MPTTLTKEEIAKEEAEILALEQAAKERWCRLKGHQWALPNPNPMNADIYACDLRCNRCGIYAEMNVSILGFGEDAADARARTAATKNVPTKK